MSSLIIGLVGLQGSGKGTVAKIFGEQHGATVLRFSTILGDILQRLHLPVHRDHQVQLSEILRTAFGEDILTRAIIHDLQKHTGPLLVLDGVRREAELEALRSLPNFVLVKIEAPLDVRYERIKQRKEKAGENGMSREIFLTHEQASTEVTIPEVMIRTNYSLQNDSTLEELKTRIDALLAQLTHTV
jgi:dephospho-CoA kinase